MRRPTRQHPVQSFINYVKKYSIKVDLILCPGDISDRTDPQGLITGWHYLEEIKATLNGKPLIATLGNHDVDSRHKHSKFDHFNFPRNVKDSFPFDNEDLKQEYFANSFCIQLANENTLLLNFNSVFSHANEESAKSSVITDEILERIEEKLITLNAQGFQYRICLTHHHPIKHANPGSKYRDEDVIEKGDQLLILLNKFDFQIVIHGHKHESRLTQVDSLPVFGAGSFASLENLQETNSKNMFHIIEITPGKKKCLIESWEYDFGIGWGQKDDAKFPKRTGFNADTNISDLCDRTKKWLNEKKAGAGQFTSLIKEIEDISYLTPTQQSEYQRKLLKDFNIKLSPQFPSFPFQIENINGV